MRIHQTKDDFIFMFGDDDKVLYSASKDVVEDDASVTITSLSAGQIERIYIPDPDGSHIIYDIDGTPHTQSMPWSVGDDLIDALEDIQALATTRKDLGIIST